MRSIDAKARGKGERDLCFDIGLVLISKWIVDQDSFYETDYSPITTRSVKKPAISNQKAVPDESDEYSSKLRELKHLLDDGLITQEDYEAKKYEILGLKGSDWDY